VDTDWALADPSYANIVLTSIVKNYDTSVVEAVQAIEDGRFSGGVHRGSLATGEVSLAPFYELAPVVSNIVKTDLEQIKQKIADGEIKTKP
jgi:basic membrane protein A